MSKREVNLGVKSYIAESMYYKNIGKVTLIYKLDCYYVFTPYIVIYWKFGID